MARQRTVFCAVISLLAVAVPREPGRGAPGKDLSRGGTLLLLGDSILDCHEGDKRIEVVMRRFKVSPTSAG